MPLIIPEAGKVDADMAIRLIQALTEAVQTLGELKNPTIFNKLTTELAGQSLERIAELLG